MENVKMEILTELFLPMTIVIGICIGIAFIFVNLVGWATTVPNAPKIKYKSFRTFYSINPNRWELDDGCVWCRTINHNSLNKYSHGPKEIFRFGFIGYLRYCSWTKREEKRKHEIDNAKITSKMLSSVKQDIETIELRAKEQQLQAIDDLQQIVNNLKRSNS